MIFPRARDRGGRRRALAALLLPAWVAAGACEAIGSLRTALHPEPEHLLPTQGAGLVVEVVPPTGITILLDGNPVASAAPWRGESLTPGPHTLEVRGMGYLPIVVPIDLAEGPPTHLPVALRPRPPAPPQRAPSPPPRLPPPPAPTPSTPPKPPALLPAELGPVVVVAAAQPAGVPGRELLVDGAWASGHRVAIVQREGALQADSLALTYRVDADGHLIVSVPADDGQWTRDGQPLTPPADVQISLTPTRLGRRDAIGRTQSLLLRREN